MIDAGILATLLSSVHAHWASRRDIQEATRLRQRATKRVLKHLERVRRLLFHASIERDRHEWMTTMYEAMGVLDEARHVLPSKMQHLGASIRSAVGEAIGSPFWARVDRAMWDVEPSEFDPVWNDNALAYVDFAIARVAAWGAAGARRVGRREGLLTFDEWLRTTGRYVPV